jgi:hypothetical protein
MLGDSLRMIEALRRHWPEYLMEAGELAIFLISAGAFTILIEYPGSPLRQALVDPLLRRLLIGLLMGATASAVIFSPWGKRSGPKIDKVKMSILQPAITPNRIAPIGIAAVHNDVSGIEMRRELVNHLIDCLSRRDVEKDCARFCQSLFDFSERFQLDQSSIS